MSKLPQHVAIIMDGNGRWAKERGLPRVEGHRRGVEVSDDIILAASDLRIRYLTLYAFSEENWSRPAEEVAVLMELLHQYVVFKREKMIERGIRFATIGDLNKLPAHVQSE